MIQLFDLSLRTISQLLLYLDLWNFFLLSIILLNFSVFSLNIYIKKKININYFLTHPFYIERIFSSVKWSDSGHFLKSQGKFFLSFPCTLFYIFLTSKITDETLKKFSVPFYFTLLWQGKKILMNINFDDKNQKKQLL